MDPDKPSAWPSGQRPQIARQRRGFEPSRAQAAPFSGFLHVSTPGPLVIGTRSHASTHPRHVDATCALGPPVSDPEHGAPREKSPEALFKNLSFAIRSLKLIGSFQNPK